MSELIWIYLTALLYFSRITSCSAIAEAYGNVSHDSLTRMLKSGWDGQILLEQSVFLLFTVSGGYFIIDDTVVEKPYSEMLSEAAWVYSGKRKKTVFGISVVMLIWTDGHIRIPLMYRVWRKGGLSKFELALELLSYARNRLKLKPDYVLFDSWYPSEKILKRIRDYGWYFVCRLKKNRKFESAQLKNYRHQPYWTETGYLSGGIRVFVVKYRRKYYATNRLSLNPKEIRRIYKIRQQIEEVFKLLKSHLNIEKCQSGYQRKKFSPRQISQEHHIVLCLTAFLIIEKERISKKMTWQKFRFHLTVKGRDVKLPSLSRLKKIA